MKRLSSLLVIPLALALSLPEPAISAPRSRGGGGGRSIGGRIGGGGGGARIGGGSRGGGSIRGSAPNIGRSGGSRGPSIQNRVQRSIPRGNSTPSRSMQRPQINAQRPQINSNRGTLNRTPSRGNLQDTLRNNQRLEDLRTPGRDTIDARRQGVDGLRDRTNIDRSGLNRDNAVRDRINNLNDRGVQTGDMRNRLNNTLGRDGVGNALHQPDRAQSKTQRRADLNQRLNQLSNGQLTETRAKALQRRVANPANAAVNNNINNFSRSLWNQSYYYNSPGGRYWANYGYRNPFGWNYGYWYPGNGYGNYWWGYPRWRAFGLTPFLIRRLAWQFGYSNYYNPYRYGGYSTFGYAAPYNYSQPLVVYDTQPTATTGTTLTDAESLFNEALAAFRNGDYGTSLELVNQAIQQKPTDSVYHEFRSLALFALGRYEESAEAAYAVLAVSPGWDWQTMIGLYGDPSAYTSQLRGLEAAVDAQPENSSLRFLLAYHYLRCEHNNEAADQLRHVLALTPNNQVATDLLAMLEGPESVAELPDVPRPTMPSPEPDQDQPASSLSADDVTGTWKATGPDNSQYSVELKSDGSFTWTFTRDGQTQTLEGVWAVENGTLALESDAGGTMVADVDVQSKDAFNFRMTGAVPDDPGLDFKRVL